MDYLKRQSSYDIDEYNNIKHEYNISLEALSRYFIEHNIDTWDDSYFQLTCDMKKYVKDRIDKDKKG